MKYLYGSVMAVVALWGLASCLGSEEVKTAPECAILSFSVGSITSSVTVKKYDSEGNATDTVVSRTIAGSDIYFNIDQVKGRIYTVDSLPNWVDLSRVVPSYLSYGSVFGKVVADDPLYYPLVSGNDSVDFNKTVELMCVSTDGLSSKVYTVDIYKHVANTDTLEWSGVASNLAVAGLSKVFYADGKVFAFSKNADGEAVVTFAEEDDAEMWSVPVVLPVKDESVVMFKGQFYGLDADGCVCRATTEQLAAVWSRVSDLPVERLLAADGYYLYAYDGQAVIGTADCVAWHAEGSEDLEMLPETSVASVAHVSQTNNTVQTAVMAGLSSQNKRNAVVWCKTSSADAGVNQPWAYIQVTADNPYGLPRFESFSMTYHNGALFAIGVEEGEYKYLYRSDDHGITWHPQTAKYLVPADLHAVDGVACIVSVNDCLWIVQESGKVWQGSIQ